MIELLEYKSMLENLEEQYLRPYISLVSNRPKLTKPKVFNDPIWHSILLYPFEIIILDSPLFQRLRRIRQLGLAHLVYPGAVHTRFEHTIGVVYQIERIADSINASLKNCLTEENINLLRISALCHDIGQGVMSHVSENALEYSSEFEAVKKEFAQGLHREPENTKLSEMVAYYFIGSPSFKQLLDIARNKAENYGLPDNAEKYIQKIVFGLPVFDCFPLFSELISGPFDADKLDYMTRDAVMSGVPVIVDIPRLILKARAVNVPQSDLPQRIACQIRGGLPYYTLTGIDLSGGRTLDELMLARTLLFDKIYHHQKLRAAEVMFASMFLSLLELTGNDSFLLPYKLTDEELISLDSTKITSIVGERKSQDDLDKIAVICDLASRIRERRLFVRCIAFAKTMPNDVYATTHAQKKGLEKLLRALSDTVSCLKFAADIAKETEDIIKNLNKDSLITNLPGAKLNPYVRISAPKTPTAGGDINRAYLIAGERTVLPFREEAAETRGWADAYILTRDIAYAFAPAEISNYVFLAAEKLLRVKYSIHIPSIMMTYAKQDVEVIDDLKKDLFGKGYYSCLPRDIWPMPLRLKKADVVKRIENIVTKASGYHGPELEQLSKTLKTKNVMRTDRVKDWLRQFENDEMVEVALKVLENILFIGRYEVSSTLADFLKKQTDYLNASLCNLGSPKDSSAVVTYYAIDIAEQYDLKSCSVDYALTTQKPIIFVDDFIGRGHQAVSILENWLGYEKTTNLGEEREAPLAERQREIFRKLKLAFVFTAGWKDGQELLQKKCEELKLDAVVQIGIHEKELPTAFSIGVFNSSDDPTPFQKLCVDIGKQLVTGSDDDSTKAHERILGYGNKANLVIFPYNTPSQTLTCIWKSGQYNGAEWMPLFPRRKKR